MAEQTRTVHRRRPLLDAVERQPTRPVEWLGVLGFGYTQPSCCRLTVSFQIFVMCRIRSPSKSMTYT